MDSGLQPPLPQAGAPHLVCCICFQCRRLEFRALHAFRVGMWGFLTPPQHPPDAAFPPCQGEYPPAFPTETVPLCLHI